jgi:membrane protease subunit (stomatin/prohibitin family)
MQPGTISQVEEQEEQVEQVELVTKPLSKPALTKPTASKSGSLKKFCSNCGTKVAEGAPTKFCNNCGDRMGETTAGGGGGSGDTSDPGAQQCTTKSR